MANDLVTSDKLISQSVISFGHITKTLQNLTDDANSTKKSLGGVLAKWLKLLCKATLWYIKNSFQSLLNLLSDSVATDHSPMKSTLPRQIAR